MTWHLAPYQRLADDDERQPSPPESSDDEQPADDSDEDGDADAMGQGERATARLLLLECGGGEKKNKIKKVKNESNLAPRTILELGRYAPDQIITQGSTFPSAEHCALAVKELSVKLRTARPFVELRRGEHGEYVSVKCACTAAKCAFGVLAGTTRRRTGAKGDDQPAEWVVRTYQGHTCLLEVPAATAGNNDAQPKHVSAALAVWLPSTARTLPPPHARAHVTVARATPRIHIPFTYALYTRWRMCARAG